jgi:hypothetical protein
MRIGDPVVRWMARRRRSTTTGVFVTTRKDGGRRETPVRVWSRDGVRFVVALYGLSWWARDLRAGRPAWLDLKGSRGPVVAAELGPDEAAEFWRWFTASEPRHAQRYAQASADPSPDDLRRLLADYPAFRLG